MVQLGGLFYWGFDVWLFGLFEVVDGDWCGLLFGEFVIYYDLV